MAVSAGRQMGFWGVGLALFALAMWALGATLVPYLAGAAIAYLLDPLADRLERRGLSRAWATAIILLVAVLILGLALALVVPELIDQAVGLARDVPGWILAGQDWLEGRFPGLLSEGSSLREAIASMEETLRSGGIAAASAVLASSLKLFDFVTILAITPVVAFYLLLDWDRMVATVDGWLPRQHAPTIREIARRIDTVMAGFVRGQLSVCLILGTFYAVALMAIGLPYGGIVGFVAGLISFIPFVGSFVGGALSIGIAVFAFEGDVFWIAVTAAIFAAGQFFEGNILSPNLVGKSVGLHPVWLMFALFAFGLLFGFVGLLVAIPAAAAVGVLVRFALARYLESPIYRGSSAGEPTPPET